jgi:hypothetical protein
MKNRRSLVPFFVALTMLAACNRVTPETAVSYNDAIVDVQAHVVAHFDDFVSTVDKGDSLGAIAALDEALDSSRVGLKKLEEMKPFDGETKLLEAAKALVNHYIKGLDVEFRGILPVITSHSATLAQLEQANNVRDAFKHEEDSLFAAVETAQKEMAQKYKFDFHSNH